MSKHKQIKRHHAKPVRKRHVGVGLFGLVLLSLAMYVLGVGSGKIIEDLGNNQASSSSVANLSYIDSSLGFRFTVDKNLFDIDGTELNNGVVSTLKPSDFDNKRQIVSLSLQPNKNKVAALYRASRLELSVLTETSELSSLIAERAGDKSVESVVADYFKPNASASSSVTLLSEEPDVIAGLNMQRRVYEIKTNLGGNITDAKTFAVYWSGLINQKPVNIKVTGLIGDSSLPPIYQPTIDSIEFDLSVAAVLNSDIAPVRSAIPGFGYAGAEGNEPLDSRFVSDLVSPSVVKIYSGVCGFLTVDGNVIPGEFCDAGTGSGFIVSGSGVVATNGHVVINEAEDLLVGLLLSDNSVFSAYLEGAGLTPLQAAAVLVDSNAVAAVIASIYDTPEDRITLTDERRRLMVSLSDEPVDFETAESFFDHKETKTIKEAKLMASDYASKDIYSAQLSSDGEFTASDVALIKVDLVNAPALRLSRDQASQNEDITVLGFPGDAENSLVNNDELAVTATNGVISSVREAVGSDSKLYQSDVDASSGNSGGPAINENGDVLGLLTYRFKNDASSDASKSYIRDIKDLIDLADDKNINLSTESKTLESWQSGLEFYSQSRFSKAKKEFEDVKEAYPAHRLASDYIDRSDKAISEGRDVKDFPVGLALTAGGVGLAMLVLGVGLFLRHNKHHKRHLVSQTMPGPVVPSSQVIPGPPPPPVT